MTRIKFVYLRPGGKNLAIIVFITVKSLDVINSSFHFSHMLMLLYTNVTTKEAKLQTINAAFLHFWSKQQHQQLELNGVGDMLTGETCFSQQRTISVFGNAQQAM